MFNIHCNLSAGHISLSVIELNRKYMNLTKCSTLVNKTTNLLSSMGVCKNFWNLEGRGVNFGGQFWKFQRGGGGGHTANPFCGGGMDIFWNHTMWKYMYCRRGFIWMVITYSTCRISSTDLKVRTAVINPSFLLEVKIS